MSLITKRTFTYAFMLAMIVLLIASLSAPSFAQDKSANSDTEAWLTSLAERLAQIQADGDASEFARNALLRATEAQETTDTVPTVTKKGIDLDGFMSRYRLDQGTMNKALEEPAHFYAFVSFSMDMKAIKQIGRDVGKAGGTLVLRGLVNNSLKETTAKIAELQNVLQGSEARPGQHGDVSVNMIVDPTLYETFRVVAVPSFVVTEKLRGCFDGDCENKRPPYDRVSGLVTVEYALSLIADDGFEAKNHAKALLAKMKAKQ